MITRTLLAFILMTSAALGVPKISQPVTDSNGYLSAPTRSGITQRIVEHKTRTGVQIAVLLVDTLNGVPIEDYSMKVAREWGGGSEARDDGVLFVLAIKDRRMRIEVGYGLEPVISDGRAAQILNQLKPWLKSKNYDTAVGTAVTALMSLTENLTPGQVAEGLKRTVKPHSNYSMVSVILIIIALALTVFVTRTFSAFGVQAGAYLGAMAATAIVMGSTGLGWAVVLFMHLLLAQFLLRTFLPGALNIDLDPDAEPEDPGPRFYRGFLLLSWFMIPLVSMDDPDFESVTTAGVITSIFVQTIMVLLLTALFGTLFHVMRAIGGSGFSISERGGGAPSPGGWHTSTHTTFDNSSWSSSSDWSSSDDSWSSSDWGGGGGDFGGGGASDSW